jgi:hypothetical protein
MSLIIKSKNMAKQLKLPKWFKGELYEEGGNVTNPYSGVEVYLNPVELSMYDFIKGCEMLCSAYGPGCHLENDFSKGLYWFKHNSYENYMKLLD